jgi:hypothetical protein
LFAGRGDRDSCGPHNVKSWYAETVEKLYKGSVGDGRKHIVLFLDFVDLLLFQKEDVSKTVCIPVLNENLGRAN